MQHSDTIRRTGKLPSNGTEQQLTDAIAEMAAQYRRDTGRLTGENPGWLHFDVTTGSLVFWYEFTPDEKAQP